MAKHSSKRSDASSKDQATRFVETAQKLGCDPSEERFDEQLRGIVKAKPKTKEPGKKPGSK